MADDLRRATNALEDGRCRGRTKVGSEGGLVIPGFKRDIYREFQDIIGRLCGRGRL